ncbi:PQQ-binding-like beta-propeller repeat protein [Solitalea sp. MAHUQ-68]|uniref:PQQ-binding-like beta-propeller repeat protein n=1 Tax=Solitalea agri TaxID=2953739 RepID=A0A9X2EZY1_9SPHI|nr:PQQ-binding-like beta-propeller repeat protein [Solitalea agri]MCO4292172.1 PQQ-binding-like beta-propeller repeat protein [Solitalea agri]
MKKLVIILLLTGLQLSSMAQTQVWKFKTKDKIVSAAAITETMILFGSQDGFLYAINKGIGKELWKFKTQGEVRSTPKVEKGKVFFNSTNGNVYALNVNTGELIWKFTTEGEKQVDMWDYYLSSPKTVDNLLIVGSGDQQVYALDQTSGAKVWSYKTDGVVHADPLIYNQKVYIGSFDGNFYALDAKTGALKWKFKTIGDAYFPKGEIQNGASIANDMIYFGSRDYNVYALNPETGTGMWNMKERGSWVIATPAQSDKLTFFGTSDTHSFYCLDAYSSDIKWKLPLNERVYGQAAFYENLVLFGCFNGKLYAVEKQTGKLFWEFQTQASKQNWSTIYDDKGHFLPTFHYYGNDMSVTVKGEKQVMDLGSILGSPIIERNIVYFGSADGYFYAVRI